MAPPSQGTKRQIETLDLETTRRRLTEKDLKDALKAANDLREHIENGKTKDFSSILTTLFPALSSVLSSITHPNPENLSDENVLRKAVLDIIGSFPKDDVLRPYASAILELCMDILAKDYEENALLASKIIFDLHKNFRSLPQDQVQRYLDFVQQVYRSLPNSVQRNFHFPSIDVTIPPASAPETPSPKRDQSTPGDEDVLDIQSGEKGDTSLAGSPSCGIPSSPSSKIVVIATSSFRVLTECPLTVMLLFQLYPKFLKTNISSLIQLMMDALSVRSPQMQVVLKNKVTTHLKRLYYNRTRELITAQVKTLSFLTYLLRGFSDQMKPHEDRIATTVVSLMRSCPRESLGTRKELLVATRHILATEFRKGFFRHVDSLLDEPTLMGSHRHSDQTTIRPLGYSTLADLVLHMRTMLTIKQLSRVVFIFSRVLHDSSMKRPVSLHLTAVRVLLNMVDVIGNNSDPSPQVGRDLLNRILETLVNKVGTLKDSLESIQHAALLECKSNSLRPLGDSVSQGTIAFPGEEIDENASHKIIDAEEWMIEGPTLADSIRDLQSMVRSIVTGLKTVVGSISNYRLPKEKGIDDPDVPVIRLTKFERDLIEKYIEFVVPCLDVYEPLPSEIGGMAGAWEQQQRDVVTYFAACFTALDSFTLRRILPAKIGLIIDKIVQQPNVMVFPRHLLNSNASTSFDFSEILLVHLVDRMDRLHVSIHTDLVFFSKEHNKEDLSSEETHAEEGRRLILKMESMSSSDQVIRRKEADTYLGLFERIIKSFVMFPDNERALRVHLHKIVSSALRLSMEKERGWPDNYCSLLRSVFRSISAGKFEDSYRALLPMIPAILNGLYRIFQASEDESLHNFVVEMSLTIPARLSTLLPHMPLLLRMIIASLKSSEGDLVNLGLRTLEFWIDNLNPDFLYPVLSRQATICTNLMTALASHLRPAPYPYGPLALRVLGKMGGNNRRFLREEISLKSAGNQPDLAELKMQFHRSSLNSNVIEDLQLIDQVREAEPASCRGELLIAFPISSALKFLSMAAQLDFDLLKSDKEHGNDKCAELSVALKRLSRKDFSAVWIESSEAIDLSSYCRDVVYDTVSDQAESALCVVCNFLAALLDLDEQPPDLGVEGNTQNEDLRPAQESTRSFDSLQSFDQKSATLKAIGKSLLLGLSVESISKDSRICAKGLFHYLVGVLTSMPEHVIKVDANGSRLARLEPYVDIDRSRSPLPSKSEVPKSASHPQTKSSFGLFGCFELTAPMDKLNPFVFCEGIAEIIAHSTAAIQSRTIDFLEEVLLESIGRTKADAVPLDLDKINTAQLAFYESLLDALCRQLATLSWNILSGLRSAILMLIDLLGSPWALRYEVELVHAAVFGLKRCGKEIPGAGMQAFKFFVSVLASLYGTRLMSESTSCLPDVLTIEKECDPPVAKSSYCFVLPSDAVLNTLIIELASTKQLVRFAARYALKFHVFDVMSLVERERKLSSQMPTIKRVIFSRSLRLLPLPEQIAVIEALTTLVDFVPRLLPVSDQHLLAFLSEFLKLSSIADGDLTDPSIVGFVVDKNGFAGGVKAKAAHMTEVFLRRDCVVRLLGDKFIAVPEEVPLGIQLRVSALRLVNTIIVRHADGFFDADASTPIGNIRPHVINLLFRSLVSDPPTAVRAAQIALQDVISLSVVTKASGEGTKSQSRLPKELLQTCIRPVLQNLRDYTRLSIPLLRGLARLLSLLGSWFNETLGEKLLEHLQKWTDPELLMDSNVWKSGDEPIVAARVLDLFTLLPHAYHFVERLVKTVIKLEAVLHRFKFHQGQSPYIRPLACFLNKHSQYAVSFFFQRLKSPIYSELFLSVLDLEESAPLRLYLSSRQCCVRILNVCFERPLAIIRSEKATASAPSGNPTSSVPNSAAETMSMHGIILDSTKDQEFMLRQDIENKQKKLLNLQQESFRTKEAFKARLVAHPAVAEDQDAVEDSKRRQKAAQGAVDKLQKELAELKKRYSAEVAKQESDSSVKKMTVDALELQNVGFLLVKTLVKYNPSYLAEHNDIVRAFRWLWRSRGRHLRVQHEELIPPRYHRESMLLGSLLVDYANACPSDVDVLFEILRIFLQQTTCDFAFMRTFVATTVSLNISFEKKKRLVHLSFALLTGDGPEETKVLCIQLILMPLLLNTSSLTSSQAEVGLPGKKDARFSGSQPEHELVDAETIRKLVHEVFLHKGTIALYGDKTRVELLRLSTLLIQSKHHLLSEHKKDVIKFSWGLLRSEDSTCKAWAYLNVCSFFAKFETPGKFVLQVYVSLLRLHQHETKGLIQSALAILLPVIFIQLEEIDIAKLIDATAKVIFEEGSNDGQLAHIWQVFITHPQLFVPHRVVFAGYMVNSLSKLGLSPSCPIEHRSLSLSVAELAVKWLEQGMSSKPTDVLSREGQPTAALKRLKAGDGEAVETHPPLPRTVFGCIEGAIWDPGMVDTVANFLVKMSIALPDTKAEAISGDLEEKSSALFSSILNIRPKCIIQPACFDRIVGGCSEEVRANKLACFNALDKKNREKTKGRGMAKSNNRSSKFVASKSSQGPNLGRDDSKPISLASVCACLRVFTMLASLAPENRFFAVNLSIVKQILQLSFLRAKHEDAKSIRMRLKEFVLAFMSIPGKDRVSEIDLHLKFLLESIVVESLHSESESNQYSDPAQGLNHPKKDEDRCIGGTCLANFSVEIIAEISKFSTSFIDSFTSSLVALSERIATSHLKDIESMTRLPEPSHSRQYQTPTTGVLHEAFSLFHRRKGNNNSSKVGRVFDEEFKKILSFGASSRSLAAIARLLSTTDLPYHFTKNRQVFFKVLGSILDASNDVHLLWTVLGIVGKWIVAKDGSSPLTMDDKFAFLQKISSIDSRRIPPIFAQLLADLIGSIVLTIAEDPAIDRILPASSGNELKAIELDVTPPPNELDSPRRLLNRIMIATMLNANLAIRQRAFEWYWKRVGAVDHMKTCVDVILLASPRRPIVDLLWELLHSDFECVGGRMWPLIFVEALMRVYSLKRSADLKRNAWFPRPNRPPWSGAEPSLPQANLVSFFSLMTRLKDSPEVQHASLLCLAHSDPPLIQRLFESLLQSAWDEIGSNEVRSLLIKPIEQLLCRQYHSQTFADPDEISNSVQSMLQACAKLIPKPFLDPGLLASLGMVYHATHQVANTLEVEYPLIRSCQHAGTLQKVVSAVCASLHQLGEQNLGLSFAQHLSTQADSSLVASLDVHGMIKEAIAGYTKLVDLAELHDESQSSFPSEFEVTEWETRWVHLQKEMGQMKIVGEFTKLKGDDAILVDVAWKNQDWEIMDTLKSSPLALAAYERGDPTYKLSEILVAISRGKHSEVENLHEQTTQLSLQKWQSLSALASGSHRHYSLLHLFHRLVEFRESGQIMVETCNHSNRRTLPDLQNLLSTWRHRLPNDFDNLADWDDILTWRTQMFGSIMSNFQWSEPATLSTLHDRPWTVIRMAKAARKQGIREVAWHSLNKVSDGSMDVSDAFSKLREQILALYNIESELERTAGLSLINTTNLGFFDELQKSELFRLKGQFLSSLNSRSKANQAYCHAVQVCPTYAKAWVSWGSLCSSLGRIAEKQPVEPDSGVGNQENPNAKKTAQYMAQAMGCFLEAVNCDTGESSRIHLPKCLWMLTKDGSSPGVISQTLESRGSALPCWVWLPWCPQLLTCLYRNEGKAAKTILMSLAKTYPQALYYPLRAFYLERRDVERSKGASSSSQQGSVVYSEELMSSLRRTHASLWGSLEAILEELIVKFRTSYEEELLATMTALLERVEMQIESTLLSAKENQEDDEAVVTSISKTLGRIGSKFFRETHGESTANKRDDRARKAEAFRDKFKGLFEADFPVQSAVTGVQEKIEPNYFLERLRKWKKMLENQVSSTPQQIPLIESSHSLAYFCAEAPDLWPMSCDPRAAKELFEKDMPLDDKKRPQSTSASALSAKSAAIAAAIAVAQAASNEGHGGEYGGGSSSIEIPGQYVPNTVSAVDSKPMPELHSKLLQFEPRVHVVCRNEQLIRRVGMIGSDGRRVQFLLQFAIPYWTRTDERTIQVLYSLEKILRRNVLCARNFLSVQPCPVIPIAQRLRMTYEREGRLSLDDVFRTRCKQAGCEVSVISNYFRHRVKKLRSTRARDDMSQDEVKEMMRSVNIDVLRDICETKVDRTILLDHIQRKVVSAENLFNFRRTFSSHLAINSLLQHALFVVVRTPSRLVIDETSGKVLTPEFRLSYNNQGFLESQKVPFRLTPNLQEMLGPIMMDGRFIHSISMTSSAIQNNMDDVDSILRLLMRDDIVACYTSKTMAKSDSKTQELENQLMDRILKNVGMIQSKIADCSIQKKSKSSTDPKPDPIDLKVKELVREASSYETLSTMETNFHPWL